MQRLIGWFACPTESVSLIFRPSQAVCAASPSGTELVTPAGLTRTGRAPEREPTSTDISPENRTRMLKTKRACTSVEYLTDTQSGPLRALNGLVASPDAIGEFLRGRHMPLAAGCQILPNDILLVQDGPDLSGTCRSEI